MIYRFLGFEADTATGTLLRDGMEIRLRRKSFQVLSALVEHHDRLVTKEEIFAEVWPDVAVTDDVLVGVIGELRKALGDNPDSPAFIRTIRGAGYRFVAPVEEIRREAMAPVVPMPARMAPPALQIEKAPRRTGQSRAMVWLATGLLAGMAGGWLLAHGGLPHIPARGRKPAKETAWWRFDEPGGQVIQDATGNGNTGVMRGSARRMEGPAGGAVNLDGVSGWVLGNSRTLPAADEPMTVTAWFQTRATNGDWTNLFQIGFPNPNSSNPFHSDMVLEVRPDGRVEAATTDSPHPLISSMRADDQGWHQVAARYDGPEGGDGVSLYLDGREQATGRWPARLVRTRGQWAVGQFVSPGTFFRGAIGDVRVYDGGLSAFQVNALYQCESSRGRRYLMPLYATIVEYEPGGDEFPEIRNAGRGAAGVQIAERKDFCSVDSLGGADLGQDVQIGVDLQVATDAAGHQTEAGPYFRSRQARPGDGILGGTSAGYWVQLHSNGTVSVRRLNPNGVVAVASVEKFDVAAWHHLEVVAVGEELQAKLDGQRLQFDYGGKMVTTVSIPSTWIGPPAVGTNQGTAGVEFTAFENNGMLGGQRARGLRVDRAASLWK